MGIDNIDNKELATSTTSGEVASIVPEVSMRFGKMELGGKVYEQIGHTSGGKFSEVIFLQDESGSSEIVVKLIKLGANQKERESFNSEIERLAKLEKYQEEHNLLIDGLPCTPSLLAVSLKKDSQGIPIFIAMSKAQGVPLDEHIRLDERARKIFNLQLSTNDVATIGEQACRVFEAVHEGLGASYYDFQPRNFFWDAEKKRLTVIDFNLLAPTELANGRRVEANPAEDFRNLSLMLFRVLTGEKMADLEASGDVQEVIRQSQIDSGLKQVLLKGVSSNTSERFRDAKEMCEAFSRVIGTGKL